jgi:hypothetical protein
MDLILSTSYPEDIRVGIRTHEEPVKIERKNIALFLDYPMTKSKKKDAYGLAVVAPPQQS